jgi:hypothetical protein
VSLVVVELQDQHRIDIRGGEAGSRQPERHGHAGQHPEGQRLHRRVVAEHGRFQGGQAGRPLVGPIERRPAVERPVLHHDEAFLQVAALRAFVAGIFERQVAAELRRILDSDAHLVGRRQAEESVGLVDQGSEHGRVDPVVADVQEPDVLAGLRDLADHRLRAFRIAVDQRRDIDDGSLGKVQDAGRWNDHICSPRGPMPLN